MVGYHDSGGYRIFFLGGGRGVRNGTFIERPSLYLLPSGGAHTHRVKGGYRISNYFLISSMNDIIIFIHVQMMFCI